MTDADYAEKLDKLERLLNDPDVPMRPALIWRLLDRYRSTTLAPFLDDAG